MEERKKTNATDGGREKKKEEGKGGREEAKGPLVAGEKESRIIGAAKSLRFPIPTTVDTAATLAFHVVLLSFGQDCCSVDGFGRPNLPELHRTLYTP